MTSQDSPFWLSVYKTPQGKVSISSENDEEDRQDSLSHRMHRDSCKNDCKK
jgi:hypothetical protein